MKNFNQRGGFGDKRGGGGFGDRKGPSDFGRRDSGGRDFGRGGSGGGRDFSRPAMHQATCAECGQSCEVPFRPTGDRPVYCSNCFKGKEGMNTRPTGGRDFSKPSFAPRGDSHSHGASNSSSDNKNFEILNSKLDRILSALNLVSVSAPAAKKEVVKVAAPEIKDGGLKIKPVVSKAKVAAPKVKAVVKKGKKK